MNHLCGNPVQRDAGNFNFPAELADTLGVFEAALGGIDRRVLAEVSRDDPASVGSICSARWRTRGEARRRIAVRDHTFELTLEPAALAVVPDGRLGECAPVRSHSPRRGPVWQDAWDRPLLDPSPLNLDREIHSESPLALQESHGGERPVRALWPRERRWRDRAARLQRGWRRPEAAVSGHRPRKAHQPQGGGNAVMARWRWPNFSPCGLEFPRRPPRD